MGYSGEIWGGSVCVWSCEWGILLGAGGGGKADVSRCIWGRGGERGGGGCLPVRAEQGRPHVGGKKVRLRVGGDQKTRNLNRERERVASTPIPQRSVPTRKRLVPRDKVGDLNKRRRKIYIRGQLRKCFRRALDEECSKKLATAKRVQLRQGRGRLDPSETKGNSGEDTCGGQT